MTNIDLLWHSDGEVFNLAFEYISSMSSFFSSLSVSNERKEGAIVQLGSALRELMYKALGPGRSISYKHAFLLLKIASPGMFRQINQYYKRSRPPQLVPEYEEKSRVHRPHKSAEELIRKDIKEIEEIRKNYRGRLTWQQEAPKLNRRLQLLHEALAYFENEMRKLNEELSIQRDFHDKVNPLNEPEFIPLEKAQDEVSDFLLPANRLLRMRFLHNTKPENVTGIDLVYEQIDLEKKLIRFVHLQYKMWDERTLRIAATRELNQLKRMLNTFCENGMCNEAALPKGGKSYRMPHCCAFVRPTSKRQSKNAHIGTTGVHIPACMVHHKASGANSLSKEEVYRTGLSQHTFEELFRSGLAGSRWMKVSEVERFYKQKKLLEPKDRIVLYAQDRIEVNKLDKKDYRRLSSFLD